MQTLELRKHERVEFLLVPVERDQVPVWLFKPQERANDIAGLIVDAGGGGMKVLTSVSHPLDFSVCSVDLLLGEDAGVTPFGGRLRRIWTQPFSKFGNVSGFEFLEPSPMASFVTQFKPDQSRRAWIRCLLKGEVDEQA